MRMTQATVPVARQPHRDDDDPRRDHRDHLYLRRGQLLDQSGRRGVHLGCAGQPGPRRRVHLHLQCRRADGAGAIRHGHTGLHVQPQRPPRGPIVDGIVTAFTWDWAAGVPEILSAGDALYLVGHETLGQYADGAWTYYLPDALGSVRQATDGAGAVVSAREWSPYGVEVGGAQAGLGYTGECFDGDVGMVYLRARWYEPGVGIFSSPDPFPGLKTQPFSLQPYAYVLANPVNATDPSGWYHSDVHFDLTWQLVRDASTRYFSEDVANKLANCIARGNEHVDAKRSELNAVRCRRCHFCPSLSAIIHVMEAIKSGDPFLFGATLHQFQDFYSHWNEGYGEEGHLDDSVRAGAVNIFADPRSPGGKSNRPDWLIKDFFRGGHYHIGWGFRWKKSPYPAHPRDDVIAEIRRRNPGIDLNGLNNDDLIDLYLRREPTQDPEWQQRVKERSHFGIDPDAYIETSTRDMQMKQGSIMEIKLFLEHIGGNVCSIDWEQCDNKPDDSAIKALLEQ